MLTSQTPESLIASIKEAPHWRVVIRPGTFVEERVKSLDECRTIIESSRVSLRGWDYPHINHEHLSSGKDWVASGDEYGSHREHWRFHQSGQFFHLFSFKEDHYCNEAAAKAETDVPELRNLEVSGYLSFLSALWTVTEIFEFTARLAQKANFGDSVSVTIQMVGVKNRVLYASEVDSDFSHPYIASEPTLSREWTGSTGALLGGASDHALDTAEWFFERFQWREPPRQVLADDQHRLLERKF